MFCGQSYRAKDEIAAADLGIRTQHVIGREVDVIRSQLARNHVALLHGLGHFVDAHTVGVVDESGHEVKVTAEKIIIAAGTRPARPETVEFDERTIIDSDGILHLQDVPDSMVVVGAGVIGIEYASMFAALGTKVTVVERRERMLDFCDLEIVEALKYHLRDLAVTFRFGESVTALDATMMLAEDGRLELDGPVDRLLPELADRRVLRRLDGPLDDTVPADRPITVEDLLTFRMGYGILFEPTFDPPYPVVNAANELGLVTGPPDPRTPHDPDEWIRRFGTLPLMHQPGERWQYNVASLVLGVLVARASGQPLEDFLRTRVFEPLSMRETGFSLPAEHTGRLPDYYMTDFQTGKLELQTLSAPSEWTRPPVFPSGAGGLLSTVDDYLTFSRLLFNKGVHEGARLLSENSVELMTTNHLTPEQMAVNDPVRAGRGWGYDMAVATAPDEISSVPGRYGWDGGYGTSWFNHPERNLIVIAMTQTSDFLFNGSLADFGELEPCP
ncbi:CubicO group peptidase (beta-lactamase class C family) [Streptosporangium album]|uniref:CubicO group peptidase (Beta-lactamase class C family) n=1 Tax=Streptosporangium album TaxID=47479 RepID=A0A7W7S3K8_9ACTN|nr:serine hydrolase [Streptosporangium album]MBB4942593.1 CubicO group peptidase (beta-lactamase class C family) [Streptosporangium album]